jgi:uncharacterized protein DUF3108
MATLASDLSSYPPHRIAARDGSRVRRSLWIALALSILIHAAWSLWPMEPPKSDDDVVLNATLTEMPAPPTAAPQSTSEKPHPKPKRVIPVAPLPPPGPETSAASANETPTPALVPDPSLATDRSLAEIAPEALAPPSPAKTLPPRLDLAYKVFLGTQGFLIGEATYRFEHHGGAYRIATVAQARGLAALFIHGKGKVESSGVITANGLQPHEFAVERGSSDKREVAHFDWDAGIVTLNDNTTLPLEPPSFDPMTLMWQAYFTPPESPVQQLNVVTTRRIASYTVAREGTETIAWPQGEIETERWHRKSDDGRIDAYFWLAPQMHYVLVKMRVSQTARGTVEALLDTIRVDEAEGALPRGGAEPGPQGASERD